MQINRGKQQNGKDYEMSSRKLEMISPQKKSYDKPRQCIKKQRHYFADKGPYSQSYGFSSSHVWMWELGNKKGWAPKNWCLWTVALEKTLKSLLDSKEIKPVNPKGNQPWIFIGKTDAETSSNTLGTGCEELTHWKRPQYWEKLKAGGGGEMVGWYHWLNGHEFEQTLGKSDGKRSLACCSPWGHRVRHDWLKTTKEKEDTSCLIRQGFCILFKQVWTFRALTVRCGTFLQIQKIQGDMWFQHY